MNNENLCLRSHIVKNAFTGLVMLLVVATNATAQPQEPNNTWPQWRGPTRDAKVNGSNWPLSLDKNHLKLLWRIPLDRSYSGPIVSTDRVFVTETRNRTDEVVYALDRKTGKELWKAQWKGSMTVPFFAARNGSWIRATPAYDGKNLYVPGMRDVLVCLDAQTGKENWRLDFVRKLNTKLPMFGFVCSPLVDDQFVYVQAGASFVKLDKQNGKIVWQCLKDEGGMNGSAFSSPYRTTLNGRDQIVVQTRTTLAGVDPNSGKVLWSQKIPAFRGMNILTPTVYSDGVFTSAYGGKSLFFRVDQKTEGSKIKIQWENKSQGYMSSPVVVGKYLYIHLRNQRMACLDLETGQQQWMTNKTFGQYWSMVAQGDKILALDQRGILYLIKANPKEFMLLDQRKISDDETWAHLAVCGNEVFVRELRAMAVYRWE